ncbi:APC family permease [Candidatus Foliamicus sp.]
MQPKPDRFARVLRTRDVLTLSFGAMIGWSWVLMTGYWVSNAGSLGTLAAFAAGGLVIGFIALTYAELASAMPRAGGEHVYTQAGLGYGWSFLCTWALLMAYVTVCAFESVALATAVEHLFPQIRLGELWQVAGASVDGGFVLVGVLGAVAMTWINVLGIRTAAVVQGIVTTVIFLSGVVLIAGAANFGELELAQPWIASPATGILAVLIMVPALLVGFDVVPQSAEEIDLPPQRIGRLLILSLVLAVAWYGAVAFSVAVALTPEELAGDGLITADAASRLWSRFAGGSWAGVALTLGGIGGVLTSWNAFMIGGSRVVFALAESGTLPAAFARLHPRYKTPYVAVLAIGALCCISPLFGSRILVWLINSGSFAVVAAYAFVPVAFLALRKKRPEMPRPYKLRYPRFVGITAIALAVGMLFLFLPFSPSALAWPQEWGLVLGWGAVSVLIWLTRRKK